MSGRQQAFWLEDTMIAAVKAYAKEKGLKLSHFAEMAFRAQMGADAPTPATAEPKGVRLTPVERVILEMVQKLPYAKTITNAQIIRTTCYGRVAVQRSFLALARHGLVFQWGDAPYTGQGGGFHWCATEFEKTIAGVIQAATEKILYERLPEEKVMKATRRTLAEMCLGAPTTYNGCRAATSAFNIAFNLPVDTDQGFRTHLQKANEERAATIAAEEKAAADHRWNTAQAEKATRKEKYDVESKARMAAYAADAPAREAAEKARIAASSETLAAREAAAREAMRVANELALSAPDDPDDM